MRHIKYEARLNKDGTRVTVIILEQTHLYADFVPNGSRSYHGPRMKITSCNCPQACGEKWTFVRGDTPSDNRRPIMFTISAYERFKEAVLAYNEEFKD
jgi:hypothetical protein